MSAVLCQYLTFSQIGSPVAGFLAMRNAGIVKMAPATRASPTAAVVRQVFSSRMVPRMSRSAAMAITAAGNVAATVMPATSPRYAFAAPRMMERKAPKITAFSVNSFICSSAGT